MAVLVGAVPECAVTAGVGVQGRHSTARVDHPGTEQALVHLHGLERAVAAPTTPLRGSSAVSI